MLLISGLEASFFGEADGVVDSKAVDLKPATQVRVPTLSIRAFQMIFHEQIWLMLYIIKFMF